MTERWSEAMRALMGPGGLQDQAAAVLRQRLTTDPRNTDALWKLAETHRRQGDFTAARNLYRRLRGRGPEPRKAAWLHATLSGNGPPEPAPGGVWPAPFVRMTNFLAPGECDRLLALVLEEPGGCVPGDVPVEVTEEHPHPEVRITLEAGERARLEVWRRIAPKIRKIVPEILTRLHMEGISRCAFEAYVRGYLTGGFFATHYDTQLSRHRWRKLNFVYFFHRRPRRFSGGDLLLYDADAEVFSQENFSRIVPLRNSIVLFPADCWHHVTPVQCETDHFRDGRWVVNGHIGHVRESGRGGAA